MLKNFSIARKFALVVLSAIAVMAIGTLVQLMQMRTGMIDQKRAEIRNTVDAAATILKSTYDAAVAAGAKPEDAIRSAGNVLRASRFDSGNYFYIYDLSGDTLMHPLRKDLEGKNNLGLKDKNGVMIIQEFIREVKAKGGGFTDYHWKKPGQDVETLKIAYNVLIPGTQAFVGSGLHADDVDAVLKQELIETALIVTPVPALLRLGASYDAQRLGRREGHHRQRRGHRRRRARNRGERHRSWRRGGRRRPRAARLPRRACRQRCRRPEHGCGAGARPHPATGD